MFWYRDYSAQYRCGACHVKTGTLAFGVFQLLAMSFAVAFFGVCFLQPEAIPKTAQATFLRAFDLLTMGYSNTNPSGRLNSARGIGSAYEVSTKPNDVPMDIIVEANVDGKNKQGVKANDGKYLTADGRMKDADRESDSAEHFSATTSANAHSEINTYADWLGGASRGEMRRTMVISKWSEEDRVAVLVLLALSLLVTGLLCLGIIRRRPSWMMPYFCLQVFDLCITCISMLAYFANVPNPKEFNFEAHSRPRYEDTLNGQLFLVLMGALIMFGKMYWISIVWACYKYLIEQLRLDLASGRSTRSTRRAAQVSRVNGGSANIGVGIDDVESDLMMAMSLSLADSGLMPASTQGGASPPKYTDVVSKIPANAHAPPPYFAVAASDTACASTSYTLPPPPPPPVDSSAPPSARDVNEIQ